MPKNAVPSAPNTISNIPVGGEPFFKVNSFHNFDIYWKIYYYNNDLYARFPQDKESEIPPSTGEGGKHGVFT
jgi:hypothetical protein